MGNPEFGGPSPEEMEGDEITKAKKTVEVIINDASSYITEKKGTMTDEEIDKAIVPHVEKLTVAIKLLEEKGINLEDIAPKLNGVMNYIKERKLVGDE
ncbi:hypothetical protein L6279_01125 [Candidatus Parcubacteria bacterium]|nr:hypothetical protein [Candidatus Parcubacteria bacterium]